MLEVLESENLMQHAQEMGAYLIERLSTNVAIQEIRGKGLMMGLEFSEPVADMRKKCCMSNLFLQEVLRIQIRFDYFHPLTSHRLR